ncbi:hypothetical protein KDN32_05975 [Nocardioides sp. J2M5]|uniref:hypothetical protein n=1 Tax=Nocardioides palaemonis TaxID=2829810 RepID=UPI001BA638BC|nr:hypothetical protein [Nocardioides palaemonis]MBS2937284.1 hypothetical protein [Nocardioides palaemonis]
MKLSLSRSVVLGVAVSLGTSVLAQPLLTAPATAAATDPASSAARSGTGWLATQLTDGVIHNPNFGGFDDYGLTVDIALSMDEVGGDQALVRQVRQAMSTRVASYATGVDYGVPDDLYSGSFAKALVFAEVSGADPRAYGGFDLVQQVEDRVITSGPTAGRLADQVDGGADYANTFGQAFAARGLSAAGSAQAAPVTDFLLRQQCSSGYFRVFFSAADAAEQSCVDGTDPTDTDTTALVVSQLAAISPRPAKVQGAIDRAVAWLASTQRTDGSFVGSEFTPDPNSNSTGLAAAALAWGGRCEQAGRAAEWVEGRQVAPGATAPLAGEDGAIAYSDDALTTARADGITDATRDQWWRATVQAVAGLTQARGTVAGVTLGATPAESGATSTVTVAGGRTGDRFCLSGPGITGTRTLVVGADGTATARVTVPASGQPTWTVSGRDGSRTAKAGSARGAITGVTLSGPSGFQRARGRVSLDVAGATAGAGFVLEGPGLAGVTVYAGSDGTLTRTVTLPKGTGTATWTLVGADGRVSAETSVLGKRRLKVTTPKGKGAKARVLVRRLVAGEKVRLRVAGRTVAKGRANAKGRFVGRVALPEGRSKVRVRAVGQFADLRTGSTVLRAR